MKRYPRPWELRQRARDMRKNPTRSERLLWQKLRKNQLGVKFRRQHVIDPYIVDFFCFEKQLVVEVDGAVHAGRSKSDSRRDKHLQHLGVRYVLRVKADDVESDIDAVVARIYDAVYWTPPT